MILILFSDILAGFRFRKNDLRTNIHSLRRLWFRHMLRICLVCDLHGPNIFKPIDRSSGSVRLSSMFSLVQFIPSPVHFISAQSLKSCSLTLTCLIIVAPQISIALGILSKKIIVASKINVAQEKIQKSSPQFF